MKIITKVVISIKTGEVLECESYEYQGPVAQCKGGSGGGGGSGKVEYPSYMTTVHNDWLDATGTDTIELSVTEAMDAALGASPWSSATAYDPTTPLTDAWTAVCALNTLVDALDHETDWSSAISAALSDVDSTIDPDTELTAGRAAITALDTLVDALDHESDWASALAAVVTQFDTSIDADTELADGWSAITAFNTLIDALDHEADWASALAIAITGYDDSVDDSTKIDDNVQAFAQVLHEDLDNVQLPKWRAGYRDANAVLSSAYPIGEAVIYGGHQRDVAKYATDLRLKSREGRSAWLLQAVKDMLGSQLKRTEFEQAVAQLSSEHKIKAHTIRVQATSAGTSDAMKSQAMRVDGEKAVAEISSGFEMKAHAIRTEAITKSAEVMLRQQMMRVEYEKAVASLSVEAKRIHIVAEKEETDQNYTFDENDARWDLETYQYGANVLAAIGGGTVGTSSKRPSAASSALGGALSGASAGAMAGGPMGAVIGGVLGLGAALLD